MQLRDDLAFLLTGFSMGCTFLFVLTSCVGETKAVKFLDDSWQHQKYDTVWACVPDGKGLKCVDIDTVAPRIEVSDAGVTQM